MKFLSRVLFNCSAIALMSAGAHAAGTYYTGNYQSPQRSYSQQSYAQRARTTNYSSQGVSAYNRNQYANAGYTNSRAGMAQQPQQSQQKRAATQTGARGFSLDAGLSKQVAMWEFEMNTAGSKLHYDNIDWLVFDAAGKYVFDVGNTTLQIGAGLQYGMQTGESNMNDDDISHGGYWIDEFTGVNYKGESVTGQKFGHALSTGVSKDGSMFGFNVGVGLTDFFKWGNLKVTPSIGWRYLKYSLETSDNKGIVFVNGDWDDSCVPDGGSIQCWPLIALFDSYLDYEDADYPGYVYPDGDGDGYADFAAVPLGNWTYAEAEGTFYFEQSGVSHSYEVEWSGPYVGLDMQYDINQYNIVTANVEFGLPSYTATGDQPYRPDWQHPKSVQDKGGIGSGFHFGMGANWRTAITDKVALTIGLTYDYYSVSGADATTYWNSEYWLDAYAVLRQKYIAKGVPESEVDNVMLNGNDVYKPDDLAVLVKDLEAINWESTADSEIESFYKSLGIRIGLNARF